MVSISRIAFTTAGHCLERTPVRKGDKFSLQRTIVSHYLDANGATLLQWFNSILKPVGFACVRLIVARATAPHPHELRLLAFKAITHHSTPSSRAFRSSEGPRITDQYLRATGSAWPCRRSFSGVRRPRSASRLSALGHLETSQTR